MHDCLVTVQVWNKLIQRAEGHIGQLHTLTKETEKEAKLKTVLTSGLSKIEELLSDGKLNDIE